MTREEAQAKMWDLTDEQNDIRSEMDALQRREDNVRDQKCELMEQFPTLSLRRKS